MDGVSDGPHLHPQTILRNAYYYYVHISEARTPWNGINQPGALPDRLSILPQKSPLDGVKQLNIEWSAH